MGSLIERKKKIMMMQGQGLLPPEYKQISWVGCSGTQYILTDFVPVCGNLSIEWKYMLTATTSGDKFMFGAVGTTPTRPPSLSIELYASNRWYGGCGTARFSNPNGSSDHGKKLYTVYVASMNENPGLLTVDGVSVNKNGNRNESEMRPFAIFATNTQSGINYIHNGLRLYYIVVKNNDVESAHFIPCIRKSDSEPGIYDIIAQRFYGNTGTGTLLIPS